MVNDGDDEPPAEPDDGVDPDDAPADADTPDAAPGTPIGSGRACDVYDLGDGTVLRRCRDERADMTLEARVMTYVREHGYPVPEVHDVSGRDLVMEKVDGPTMMESLAQQPWKLLWHARRLASLQRRLARIAAPDWLLAPGVDAADLGHAQSVLHLDLHPMNVILSQRHGPMVIDWTNAAAGPAGFDAALTYVEGSAYQADTPRDRIGQRIFVEAFRRSRGKRLLDPYIVAACDHRLADPGTEPDERVAVAELRARYV
ncbi:MAG: phosphotransferase [Actinomycetota bacterium]